MSVFDSLPNAMKIRTAARSGEDVYLLTDEQLLHTADVGETWNDLNVVLPSMQYPGNFAASESHLFVTYGGEMWRLALADVR